MRIYYLQYVKEPVKFLNVVLFFITSTGISQSKAQSNIEFKANNIKNEINSMKEATVSFKLKNNSKKTFVLPNVLSYNSLSDKSPNLDIGYEVYREEAVKTFILLDSCFIFSNPQIPEEGIRFNKYGKGRVFMYESQLPIYCINKKGRYKIRFTFFLKDTKGKKTRILSEWHYFTVINDLL